MPTKLLKIFFVSFFDLYKECSYWLISFSSFSELFPAFNCAKEISNRLSIWFRVSIFSPCPDWILLLSSRTLSAISNISSFSSILSASSLGAFSMNFLRFH